MKELIDKAEVVTEIDKIINEANYVPFTDEVLGKLTACKKIKNFINTLEVKEVDLDNIPSVELAKLLEVNNDNTEGGNGYTVKDKGFDCGDGIDEVSFAWNEGEIIKNE